MTADTPPAATRILCGVDGSDAACRAAETAGRLGRDLAASLTFVSVAQASKLTPELERYLAAEGQTGALFPNITSEAEACLRQAASMAASSRVVGVKQIVEVGDPFQKICDLIDKEGVDLLVLGRHRRSSVERLAKKPLSQKIADVKDIKILLIP